MGSSHRMNNQLGWDKQEVPQTQSRTACLRLTTPHIVGPFGKARHSLAASYAIGSRNYLQIDAGQPSDEFEFNG